MARSHDSGLPNRAYQDQGAASGLAGRPTCCATDTESPATRVTRSVDSESTSTNGLPGPYHAHLAASSQRSMGVDGHNLTELCTDLARVTFQLDHDDDEGLFGTDPLS
jgi:hypothetical protein